MVNGEPVGNVLSVTGAEQSFAFDNVPQAPTPSLLREFSAPVRLEYPYSDRQLTFLMQYARNDFARWDAAQMLLAKYVRLNVSRSQQGQPLSLPEHVVAAFGSVLADERQDPALRAQILTLPSEVEMAELFSQIDPGAIAQVHQALTRLLARQLAAEWLQAYQRNTTPQYRIEHGDIARRALRNVCLRYLAFGDDVAQADAWSAPSIAMQII